MRQMLSCATALGLIWLSLAGAQTQKPVARKQPQKAAAKGTPTARKGTVSGTHKAPPTAARTTTASAARKGTATRRTASKRPAVTWRTRQMAPSSDRYREIQSALVARGYLGPEEATGNWNQSSADALKRFQIEQNLDSSGKINSLSLIALGLGPKHDSAAVVPPKPVIEPAGQ